MPKGIFRMFVRWYLLHISRFPTFLSFEGLLWGVSGQPWFVHCCGCLRYVVTLELDFFRFLSIIGFAIWFAVGINKWNFATGKSLGWNQDITIRKSSSRLQTHSLFGCCQLPRAPINRQWSQCLIMKFHTGAHTSDINSLLVSWEE